MKLHTPLLLNVKTFIIPVFSIISLTFGFGQTVIKDPGIPKKTVYSFVNTTEKVVAITFDDGPLLATTPKLLDHLKAHDAKATFFVVGNMIKWHKDTLKRIADEGHEIANHTVDHPDISKLDDQTLIKNLETLNQSIKVVTGVTPRWFRPPFGTFRKEQAELIYNRFGMSTALWNVDPQDWKSPGVSVVVDRIVNGVTPGAIIVTHDIMPGTRDAMPEVITRLKAKGYKFVTLSELVKYDKPKEEASKPTKE